LRVGTWEDGVILLSRPGATASYDPAVRVLGSAWFMFLAVACGAAVLADSRGMGLVSFGPAEWIACIARGCLVLFYLVLWWLMLLRPSPIARSDGWLPSLIALVGTYLPWTIPLFASSDSSAGRDIASAVFLLAGAGLMIVVIVHLGRSFSIVPQARHLVTSGPYAIVRNPLYLAEEIALLGMLLQFWSLATLAVLLVHGALQLRRIFYEEGLLRRSFADYDRYARATRRLVPSVW
jgi:protein-S-isoprenylcysteine O-methyltransferase Ste14